MLMPGQQSHQPCTGYGEQTSCSRSGTVQWKYVRAKASGAARAASEAQSCPRSQVECHSARQR
eukprot:6405970-Pyramimonas_sp.AAC.1